MLFALLSACLVSSVPARPARQEGDAARLVPADSAILVRVESVRALNELVRVFAPVAGPEAARFDLQARLDSMAVEEEPGAPRSLPLLAPDRPLFMAFGTQGMAPTLVAPVTNGVPFRFHPTFGGGGELCVPLGNYTGVSLAPGYAASTAPNPLVAALRPGLVSVHVDLAGVIAAYRPLIDMGLRQFEASLDQFPSDGPFDVQPLMEQYLAFARGLLDTAVSLDFVLAREGGELVVRCDYVESVERPAFGPVGDVEGLLGYVDPASALQFAFNGKWTETLVLFEDFVDAGLEMYPASVRADLRQLLAAQRALDPLLAPGLVMGFDLGAEGMRGSYVMRSTRPGELLAALEALLRGLDHPHGLLSVGAAERLVVGGLEARVLPVEIHYEELLQTITDASEDGETSEVGPQLRQSLETLYGRDLRMALAVRGELVALCFGSGEAGLRASLERLSAPASSAPVLARLLGRLDRGALAFVYHLDFGQTMQQMLAALRGLMPGPMAFPSGPFAMDFFGARHERTWSGGMSVSVTELIDFARALAAVEQR